MTRRAEHEVQRAVIDHLRWRRQPNLFWAHIPNGGRRSPIEARVFAGLGVRPGAPDLILIHRGGVFGLEPKSATGRLTTAQRDCHAAMRAAGAEVEVATSIDAAVRQLEKWQLLRGLMS